MRCKKIVALCLSAALAAAMLVPAYAAVTTPGGTGETTVQLTADAATFDVTVPTTIAIKVNADGTVTCPSNVEISNNSTAGVKVTKIEMNNGDWSLVSYNTDFAHEKVDTHKLGFQMQAGSDTVATSTDGNQTLTHNEADWTMAAKGDKVTVTCDAKASAVSAAIADGATAATIVFTIGWAK